MTPERGRSGRAVTASRACKIVSFEPQHYKTNKVAVRLANTLISPPSLVRTFCIANDCNNAGLAVKEKKNMSWVKAKSTESGVPSLHIHTV